MCYAADAVADTDRIMVDHAHVDVSREESSVTLRLSVCFSKEKASDHSSTYEARSDCVGRRQVVEGKVRSRMRYRIRTKMRQEKERREGRRW